jgi:methylase of polypeptide subunit release factors
VTVQVPSTIAALRAALARAGYEENGVKELVRKDGLDAVRGLAVLRLRREAQSPLGRLVRLFLAGEELGATDVGAAITPVSLEALETEGLLERTLSGVRACVRLDAVRGMLIASDQRRSKQNSLDCVVYPGPGSFTLASLTVRSPVAAALDLCCGSGIQTLLAARHARRVVGCDLNSRALRLAELSAGLSAVENVEWRRGDLFEPVAGEQFDLVVANPPFVISPARQLTFRDSGRRGDELSREVLIGTAARLNEGGYGHVLCSWVRAAGEHFLDTPQRWLASSGCDVLVLHLDTESSATYAIRWTDAEAGTLDEAVVTAAAWVDHYETLGIEAIATGIVVMRRRAGSNWTHGEELVSAGDDAGWHVRLVFEGHDALERVASEQALLDSRLSFPPGVKLVQRIQSSGQIERARLSAHGGVQLPATISPNAAASALAALEQHTLSEAAAVAGVARNDIEAALPSIRELVRRGYLLVNDLGEGLRQ